MVLVLNHLFSKSLNIYGDYGNVKAIKYLVTNFFKDVELEIYNSELGEDIKEADIYLIGGGQDADQFKVFKDLLNKREFINEEVQKGKIFILICGGYQLFGKYFLDAKNNLIDGLGILDITTEVLSGEVSKRCIGNLIVEMSSEFIKHWNIDTGFSKTLVGFENHGGQTKLLSEIVKPIGKVLSGYGNNFNDGLEGVLYKNVIGTYLHGSLLPKNPHLGFAIVNKALKNKYRLKNKIDFDFNIKNLVIERKAHSEILKRYG